MTEAHKVLTYSLLVALIIIWAVGWPVSKIGLLDMPPIWYSALRLAIGFIMIFLLLLVQNKLIMPKRQDLPMLLSIGLVQMASFLTFLNGGLMFVDAGRSAILVYSTPFLVTPIAVLFFHEKLTPLKLLGLIFGFIGILLLFNPWSFNWHDSKVVIGNSLLILAALCWAISMLHTRYGVWHSSSIQLVPWQLLIGTIAVVAVAAIIEPHPIIHWTKRLWWTAAYNGLFATGFGYAAILYVSQKLPVTNTSVLLLGVPILGLVCSAWWLHEPLTVQIIVAMLFIVAGLAAIPLDKPIVEQT